MNIGVIFAGGVGTRMRSRDIPKQFLIIHGKPIIVHTLEHFQNCNDIDAVVISCVKEYIDHLESLVIRYNISKVKSIVPGGETGQRSIFNGLLAAKEIAVGKSVVLIHDGVRPLINARLLSKNIECVKNKGSAITVGVANETIIEIADDGEIVNIPQRKFSRVAKAPQCFWLDDILAAHKKASEAGMNDFIDSCSLMRNFGYKLYTVDGPSENIKITAPDDYFTMQAILDARENNQLYVDDGD